MGAPATTDLPAAVSAYAAGFHAAVGSHQHVASPLGAYLLLGLLAPLTAGDERAALERVLGIPADDAHRAALTLLRFPHPAVGLALSVWHEAALEHARIGDWLRDLPRGLARAGIPGRPALDRWAHDATHGLIPRFPVEVTERTVLLLASALATRERWIRPFEVVDGRLLGAHAWPSLRTVLLDPRAHRPIVRTAAAGLVGASSALTGHSLLVTSVVAEASVTPAAAVAAAHEVTRLACRLPCEASVPSLFDLPVDGHAWSIAEEPINTSNRDGREEAAAVLIPAWTVPEHTVDLAGDPAFGFTLARDAVRRALPPIQKGYEVCSRQAATATFGRYGFEAGAVTAWDARTVGMIAPPRRRGLRRHATVRFARPFAVVAVVSAPDTQWHGVPVFSGWITTPMEADGPH